MTAHRGPGWVFFFQAEDGIRDGHVTGVQTCALPIFTLVSRPEEIENYDRAFEVFWDRGGDVKAKPRPKVRLSIPQPDQSVMPPKKTVEKSERGEEAVH